MCLDDSSCNSIMQSPSFSFVNLVDESVLFSMPTSNFREKTEFDDDVRCQISFSDGTDVLAVSSQALRKDRRASLTVQKHSLSSTQQIKSEY